MRSPFQDGNPSRIIKSLVGIPSRRIEYSYYLITAYTILGGYFGLEIPLVAAGSTVALAFLCLQHFGASAKKILAPVGLLLACIISFIVVQIVLYEAWIRDWYITDAILWICGIIIMQSLALRPRFVYRCAIVLFAIALIPLRDLGFNAGGGTGVDQAHIEATIQGHLSHPAGLAYWFGFCAVFFAIAGLEDKRVRIQILYWMAAVGSLLVVALTVQRGPLLATAIAITIAFRRILKRGFLPVLLLIILTGTVIESGLLVDPAAQYQTRGLEETGRLLMWPIIIERILESPLVGVGYLEQGTQIDIGSRPTPPHNTFLQFALTSGIIPFAFFVAFWIRATIASLTHNDASESAVFRLPFLVYAFVLFMSGDVSAVPPVLLMLAVVAGRGIPHPTKFIAVLRRTSRAGAASSLGRPSPVRDPR